MEVTEPTRQTFLALIRLGIGHVVTVLPQSIKWESMYNLAYEQGLSAIMLDGAEALSNRGELVGGWTMDKQLKKQWIAEVIQNHEQLYEDYRKSIGRLAQFYDGYGVKMMVLKGYGLSLNYPIPEHRPCGDIDIWLFGEYQKADSALRRELGIKIDESHHHHTSFHWNGYLVENHYDWLNVYAHRSSAQMEKVFKELAKDDSNYVEIDGQRVYLPSPNLHALFVLRHSMSHFAAKRMKIRQLLDWGFFVEKHTKEIDWDWLIKTLEQFHMLDFFTCLNSICVSDFGFDFSIFPPIQIDVFLKDRILNDMLSPEFSGEPPSGFLKLVFFKYRRWKANEWKHKLCYQESMFSSFWRGVWARILKPAMI